MKRTVLKFDAFCVFTHLHNSHKYTAHCPKHSRHGRAWLTSTYKLRLRIFQKALSSRLGKLTLGSDIMKTQLLEDIGQSATLSLVPSGRAIAQVRAATPAKPRSAFAVWRPKPAAEPLVVAAETLPVLPSPVHEVVIPPVEPEVAAIAPPSENAPSGPVFDFTPLSPTIPSPEPFIHEPSWFERSGKGYLIWGSCALAGALVIYAGLFYEERKDARAPALVADQSKAQPQVVKAVKPRAIAAKEFTLGPDGEVQATPAAPPPPLVLLAPEPAAEVKLTSAPPAVRAARQAPPKPERARVKRAPERQLARAPVIQAEKKAVPDTAMAATLKACREHGYHPGQCVKRGCSMTKYGFVCRGK